MSPPVADQHPEPPEIGLEQKEATRRLRAAYQKLMEQNEATLLRAAFRFCPGQADHAQDLVQETLIRGYEAFLDGRFQEGTHARAWLLKILTNCFLMNERWRRRMSPLDLDSLLTEGVCSLEGLQAAPADQPEAALLDGVLDEPLENALAALPEEMRICVILVDMEEMTYAEVADLLKIPVGTVRSRLFRARQQLYTRLYSYAREQGFAREKGKV